MDRIFEAYNGEGGFSREFARKSRERIHWTCSQVWGRKVLDVGCSQGIGPILLGRMGYEVMGIDINPEAIAYAKKELAKESEEVRRKVQFACVNFLRFKNDDWTQVDAIVMGEVLEHLVRPADFIAKAFQLLKPAGRLVVTVPFGINDDPDHRQTFYLTNIYTLLHPFFDIVGVKFLGSWVGFVTRRREAKISEPPQIPLNFFRQAEEAFFGMERPLRDEIFNAKAALKRANDAVAAAKSNVGSEVEVVESKVGELTTALEVEKSASRGYQEQIAVLKAMLQFVSSQQNPAVANATSEQQLLAYSQETRELLAANGDLKAELAVAKAERSHLEARLQEVEETVDCGEKKAAEERSRLEQELAQTRIKLAESQGEGAVLRMELTAAQASADDARAKAAAQEGDLSRIKETNAALKLELQQGRSRLEKETAALAGMNAENESLRAALAQAKAMADEIADLRAALEDEKSWSVQHKAELEAYREKMDQQMASLLAVSASDKNRIAELESALSAAEKTAVKELALHKKFSAQAYESDKTNAILAPQLERSREKVDDLTGRLAAVEKELSEKSHALRTSEARCSAELKAHKRFSAEAYALQRQVATMKCEMAQLLKEKKTLARRYEKLSKSKLGRLTLKYWAFKDGLRSRDVGAKKPVPEESVPAMSDPDATAWTKQRENEERFFRKG